MIISRVRHSAVFASWLNLTSRLIGLVALVPIALAILSIQDFVLWQMFLSVLAFGIVLDFGLSPTLARFTSYSFGGDANSKEPNWPTLYAIYKLSSIIYALLACLVLVLLLLVGTEYFSEFFSRSSNPDIARLTWYLVAVSTSLHVFGLYQVAFLQGIQKIPKQQFAQCFAVVVASTCSLLMLFLTEQLLWFMVAYLSMVPIAFMLNRRTILEFWNDNTKHESKNNFYSDLVLLQEFAENNATLLTSIWGATWRSGLGVFAVLGFTHACGLIVAKIYEPEIAAACLLAFQIMRSISTISAVPFITKIPQMSASFAQNNEVRMMAIATSGLRKSYFVFTALASVFVLFSNYLLLLIKPEIMLMSNQFLAILTIAFFLERFGAAHMQLLAVKNIVLWHLANGLAVLVAIALLIFLLERIGIIAFPFSIVTGNIVGYCIYLSRYSYLRNKLKFPTFDFSSGFIPGLLVLLGIGAWSVLAP